MKKLHDRIIFENDEGQIHRVDGPAMFCDYGDVSWWQDNVMHRVDGPAFISTSDTHRCCDWYLKGKRHRDNLPAVEYTHFEGGKPIWYINEWYQYDKRHRIDGPAIESTYSGHKNKYYINGIEYTEQEFKQVQNNIN